MDERCWLSRAQASISCVSGAAGQHKGWQSGKQPAYRFVEVQDDGNILLLILDGAQELLHANLPQVTEMTPPPPLTANTTPLPTPLQLDQPPPPVGLPGSIIPLPLAVLLFGLGILLLIQLDHRPTTMHKPQTKVLQRPLGPRRLTSPPIAQDALGTRPRRSQSTSGSLSSSIICQHSFGTRVGCPSTTNGGRCTRGSLLVDGGEAWW